MSRQLALGARQRIWLRKLAIADRLKFEGLTAKELALDDFAKDVAIVNSAEGINTLVAKGYAEPAPAGARGARRWRITKAGLEEHQRRQEK